MMTPASHEARGIDREAVEGGDHDGDAGMGGNRLCHLFQQPDTLVCRDEPLFPVMHPHAQHQPVDQAGGAGDDVEMAVGDGIEDPG